jgi:hypothetical protein
VTAYELHLGQFPLVLFHLGRKHTITLTHSDSFQGVWVPKGQKAWE